MEKKKSKIVYRKEEDRKLNSEELNAKEIQELKRRLDALTIELCSSDSECAPQKIPELEKRIDKIVRHIALNDNEFRIFRDVVFALQREIYPKLEKL